MNKFFLLLVVLLLGMGGVGVADEYPDERPLSPDYSKLYYLGDDRLSSSSPCIGNPVTPECAIVTKEACKSWWDQSVCDTIGYKLPGPRGKHTTPSHLLYKFVSKKVLVKEDIPKTFHDTWKEGDILVFSAWQYCKRYDHCFANLPDRSDPKKICLQLDCDPVGGRVYKNGKHAPDVSILREQRGEKWMVVDQIFSWDFDRMKNRPEKLFQEGLAQMPW